MARRFGHRFVERLAGLPAGSWQGPVASRYGLHLVFLERTEPSVPPLDEVRDEVRARVRQELADEWLALRLEQLRSRYRVVVADGGETLLAAGGGG